MAVVVLRALPGLVGVVELVLVLLLPPVLVAVAVAILLLESFMAVVAVVTLPVSMEGPLYMEVVAAVAVVLEPAVYQHSVEMVAQVLLQTGWLVPRQAVAVAVPVMVLVGQAPPVGVESRFGREIGHEPICGHRASN